MKNLKRLTPVVVAVGLLAIGQAAVAGEPIQFGDGYVFDWRINTTYTLSTRLKDRDPLLALRAVSALADLDGGAYVHTCCGQVL